MDSDKPKRPPQWISGAVSNFRKRSFFLPHAWVILLEIFAVCVLLAGFAAGLFFWRLSQGPIDVSFMRDYIETALSDPAEGLTPNVEGIVLSWPDVNGPLLLGFRKAKIFNAKGEALVSVDEAALSISKTALLIGKISPVALIVKEPIVQVTRDADGSINFGVVGVQAKASNDESKDKNALVGIYKYIAHPGAVSGHGALGTLEGFKIENARVVIDDKALGTSWVAPRLDASFQSKSDAMTGSIDLELSEDAAAPSYFKMGMSIPWDTRQADVKAELKNFDPWFFTQKIKALAGMHKGEMSFDAQAAAILDPSLKPLKAVFEMSSPQGKFVAADISDHDVEYTDAKLAGAFDASLGKFNVTAAQATIEDVPVQGKASFDVTDGKISGPAQISIASLTQKKVAEIWPPVLEHDAAKEWAVDKMSAGTFQNLYAGADILATKGADGAWDFSAQHIAAGGDFSGMNVDYRAPLAPVKNGKGSAKFTVDDERLNVKVEGGTMNDLVIKSGEVDLVNILTHGKGTADIKVNLEGALKNALEYVSNEPINMKHKFDLAKVKGQTSLGVDIFLPTLHDIKMKDVKIAVDGSMSDIMLPDAVKTMSLTGGPYKISIKDNLMDVAGEGALGGAAGKFDYKEFLESEGQAYKSSVTASLTTTPEMRLALGADLTDFVDGNAPGTATYTEYQDGHAEADVKADLGPAHIFFDPLGYDKPPGKPGSATLKVKMQNGHVKEISNLEVTAPDLSIGKASLGFRAGKDKSQLSKGDFPSFAIGETKGQMHFDVDESGRYKINVTCPMFDLGPAMKTGPKKPYTGPAMTIDMTAAQMKGADGSKLGEGKFHIDRDAQGRYDNLEVTAAIGAKGEAVLTFRPDEKGVRTFNFDADDAGATLAAFGIYKNIIGGKMNVHGQAKDAASADGGRDIYGDAAITDFKVVHAPTLARLISAMSLTGVLSILNNEGLGFSKLQADFVWDYKREGSVLSIKNGRTSGNSVGFTFEGDVNQADSTLAVAGTMVPLSGINKFIGKIPLVGDILTGGHSGGIIAATYTVKGKTAEPNVMVNPLSVLTPGILRSILFE